MTEAVDGDDSQSLSRTKKLAAAAAVVVAGLIGLSVLTGQDVIDLPEWANVPGVDLPVIGDTDQIDCRLSIADENADPVLIQIDVVDGDADTYSDYQYIWNNGNLVDSTGFERIADDRFVVPVGSDRPEQFFSISIEPERENRVWCESIVVD